MHLTHILIALLSCMSGGNSAQTTRPLISMNKLTALQSLRKGTFAIARIVSKKKPLKAYAQHDITKVVLCTVRAGIEYRNQKEVIESGKEVGSLPWGEWESYPYAIGHKGTRYLRLYLGQSLKVFYLVDGVKVATNVAKQMLPKSNPTQKPLCITVKETGLVSLKQKGKELIK